jgi:hypothetical protein
VARQVTESAERIRRGARGKRVGFLAYFQPYTNTDGPVEELERLYREALEVEGVVGLAIGTRPDCVGEEVTALLERFARETYVQVELGLPSIRGETLRRIGRGHGPAAFYEAMQRLGGRGIDRCVHLITFLPGEGREEALETARAIARAGAAGVKIHNLHVLDGTSLAEEWRRGGLRLPTMEEHVATAADILEHLPPTVTIQRICGNAPAPCLLAPDWCRDAGAVGRAVEEELARRGTRQGVFFPPRE